MLKDGLGYVEKTKQKQEQDQVHDSAIRYRYNTGPCNQILREKSLRLTNLLMSDYGTYSAIHSIEYVQILAWC